MAETAAVFGPSRTTVTSTVAAKIDALVACDALRDGDALFHADNDRRAPLAPYAWTRLVQASFKAHGGVALSPKDCRASFVTCAETPDRKSCGLSLSLSLSLCVCVCLWTLSHSSPTTHQTPSSLQVDARR